MNLTAIKFKEIVKEALSEKLAEHDVNLDEESIEEISDNLLEKIEEAELGDGADEDE